MRILITGGAGYIGSHIALVGLERGHDIYVLDSLERGFLQSLLSVEKILGKKLVFTKGDVGDVSLLEDLFLKIKPDAVIHCAGYKSVSEGEKEKELYTNNNIIKSRILLQKCVKHSVDKFIFSSSAATYGNPEYLPIDENHPQKPINHYGLTKLATESDMIKISQNSEIKTVSLRYFNAVGNHFSGNLGEDYRHCTNFIPIVLSTLSGFKNETILFGDMFKTRDGSQERDYVHVVDLANAHMLAVEKKDFIHKYNFYNLSTNKATSCKEIIHMAEEISGKKLNFKVGPPRHGDPEVLYSKNLKAKHELGWEAIFSVQDAIKHQWKWFKKSGGEYLV